MSIYKFNITFSRFCISFKFGGTKNKYLKENGFLKMFFFIILLLIIFLFEV